MDFTFLSLQLRGDNFSKVLWQLAISIFERKKSQEEGCVFVEVNSTAREASLRR